MEIVVTGSGEDGALTKEDVELLTERELTASYERSMNIGRESLVTSFQIAGNPERIYTYDNDKEGGTCTEKEKGGGKRVLFSADTYWPEQKTWSLYNKRGELIRKTEAFGKTIVYD